VDVTTPKLVAMAKKIEARGALDIAKRALQTCRRRVDGSGSTVRRFELRTRYLLRMSTSDAIGDQFLLRMCTLLAPSTNDGSTLGPDVVRAVFALRG
ncbi:MAG: hypothetical protein ABI699_03690, partial [Caldimonas sp.]